MAEREIERKREEEEVVEAREAVLEVKVWYTVYRRKKRSRKEKGRRKRRDGAIGGFGGEIERISVSLRERERLRLQPFFAFVRWMMIFYDKEGWQLVRE